MAFFSILLFFITSTFVNLVKAQESTRYILGSFSWSRVIIIIIIIIVIIITIFIVIFIVIIIIIVTIIIIIEKE